MLTFQSKAKNLSPFKNEAFLYNIAFLIIIIVAFYIRYPLIFTERLGSDEALYSWYAERIIDNPLKILSKEIIEYHPPLIATVYAFIKYLFPSEWTLRHCAHLINILELILLFLLGSKLKNKFLALFCAVHLTFNPHNIMYGNLIMLDVPLSCLWLLLLILCSDVKVASNTRLDWQIGVVSSLIILCKWSGLIVIPFLTLFYWALPGARSFREKLKKLIIPLRIVLIVTAGLLINNIIQLGHIYPNISALSSREHATFSLFYLQSLDNLLTFPYLLFLATVGFFYVWKNEFQSRHLLFLFIITGLTALSFTYVKKYEYMLFLIPIFLLFAGFGINGILEAFLKNKKFLAISRGLIIFSCLILGFNYFPNAEIVFHRNNSRLVGFKEAAAWTKSHVRPETRIIAQSPRILRYYTKINYEEYGGKIIPCPVLKEDIAKLISKTDGHIILIANFWAMNKSFRPFLYTDNEEDFFSSLNLRISKTIVRETYYPRLKKIRTPVIKIYERIN